MENKHSVKFDSMIELLIVFVGFSFLGLILWAMISFGDKYITVGDTEDVCKNSEEEMLFEIKSLSAERHRLSHELELCQSAMYPVPADIQQPLPYKQ